MIDERPADIGVDPATGMLTIALDAGTSVVKYALSVADTVTVASLDSVVQLRRAEGTRAISFDPREGVASFTQV